MDYPSCDFSNMPDVEFKKCVARAIKASKPAHDARLAEIKEENARRYAAECSLVYRMRKGGVTFEEINWLLDIGPDDAKRMARTHKRRLG